MNEVININKILKLVDVKMEKILYSIILFRIARNVLLRPKLIRNNFR